MGSVEPGKDADLVLWSDNPLSIRAKAMMTFVDGAHATTTGAANWTRP
jgi:imidazolonepropionase-like amidohydrolase